MMIRPIHIVGGRALIDGDLVEADVTLADGVIAAIDGSEPSDALTLDASGLLVLPGIVDIHGDAFERQIMPRPGVRFDFPLALADTDRQLATAGITTAYHGLTLSWEPGLRSIEAGRDFIEALERARPSSMIDHRVQLRFETFAFEAVDDVVAWLQTDPAPTLAFNDHTSTTVRKLSEGREDQLSEWSRRAGISDDAYLNLLDEVWKRQADVDETVDRLAATARQADTVMLSHDDRTRRERARYRGLGARIAEFPVTREAIEEAGSVGEPSVLGAPNVGRGGSHTGALAATDMIEEGLCTILASDYHYPSMLEAVSCLIRERGMSLSKTWSLIAEAPASALKLNDRGRLESGLLADLLMVRMHDNELPRVVTTISRGRLAFLSDENRIA